MADAPEVLAYKLEQSIKENAGLKTHVEELSQRLAKVEKHKILNPNLVWRSLAVYGHLIVGQAAIGLVGLAIYFTIFALTNSAKPASPTIPQSSSSFSAPSSGFVNVTFKNNSEHGFQMVFTSSESKKVSIPSGSTSTYSFPAGVYQWKIIVDNGCSMDSTDKLTLSVPLTFTLSPAFNNCNVALGWTS
jgi:hypothetical protein